MPVTRSSARQAASGIPTTADQEAPVTSKRKRPVQGQTNPEKRARQAKGKPLEPVPDSVPNVVETSLSAGDEDIPVPSTLSFDFEEAKEHLIRVDSRFQDLFARMPCRPFEELDEVHPFRALTISILGQQISWKAARSITHKFIRLYHPEIAEDVTDESRADAMRVFPTPSQVRSTDPALLRTAGLSTRKAEYVQDLAERFVNGRLSTEKLRKASDEELAKMLIQVKGIGKWTVDMFAIFSLRRPDILPVGDLGVQRGLVRWFLSRHSPAHPFEVITQAGGASGTPKKKKKVPKASGDELPRAGDATDSMAVAETEEVPDALHSALGESSALPTPFTPSIRKTLEQKSQAVDSLPAGLSVSTLKGRLGGNKIKGAFLTPDEMTKLTESWKPYRSLGVYYMWALAAPEE